MILRNWWKIKILIKYFLDGVSRLIEKPILTSFVVLICLSFIVIGFSLPYYIWDFDNFYPQILAEAHGMLFDIAVIGILIFWLNKRGDVKLRISTYKDEIDDFRLWESEEAAFRIVGNIKRLNRHNIFDIDLVNTYLVKTNLNYVKLSGSNLNSANLSSSNLIGIDLSGARLNQTNLENANLNQANLDNSFAGGANFRDAFLIKSNLKSAFLIKADFCNAFLMEADLRGSYLSEANFENASLYKADLRGAEGLTIEQLSKSKTLYLAKLNNDLAKKAKLHFPELLGEETEVEVN